MQESTSITIDKINKICIELLMLSIWTYVFVKLFVFNIDELLINDISQQYLWIYQYRFIFLILYLSVIWYLVGTKSFAKVFSYTLFYPIILIIWKFPKFFLWKIPKLMFLKEKWLLMYTYLNGFINQLFNLRKNMLGWSIFLITILIIFNQSPPFLLWISLISLSFLLVYHFYQRFKLAFSPIRMFRLNLNLLSAHEEGKPDMATNTINGYEKFIEENKNDVKKVEDRKIQTIETLVFSHHFLRFITTRLNEFKDLRIYMAASSLKILSTFLVCVALITLMNLNIYHLDSKAFEINTAPTIFNFFYYSFHSIFFNSVETMVPMNNLAKTVNMLAPFLSIVVTVFLITLYFSVKSERYKENIDKVIVFSNQQLVTLETTMNEKFNHTIIDALEVMKNLKSPIYKLIYRKSEELK